MTIRYLCLAFSFLLCSFAAGCNESTGNGNSQASPPAASETAASSADSTEPILTVMPGAAAAINQILDRTGPAARSSHFLRVRVVAGGCQGFMFKLDLDTKTAPDDYSFMASGVRVVVSKGQLETLRGIQIDYVDDNGKQGFTVENPAAKSKEGEAWLASRVLQKNKEAK